MMTGNDQVVEIVVDVLADVLDCTDIPLSHKGMKDTIH